jgi:type III secretory pathway component EscR
MTAQRDAGGLSTSFRDTFRLDTGRGQAATLSLVLFLAAPILGVFVSRWFFLLLVPAVLLSIVGLLGGGSSRNARGLGGIGLVMAFNGVALMISLFVVGFIADFLRTGQNDHETSSVAVGYTTVHAMLGVGLMLYDNYRHRSG